MSPLHPVVAEVTARIAERSRESRAAYLARIDAAAGGDGPHRAQLSCGNLAHGFAGCSAPDKAALREGRASNLGIVTAYNDMLSAHRPYERYPGLIRDIAREFGATAQVAGGVPAMCDGITQGRAGMELSLFSRDVIAMATAVALSHDMFDGALYLGICDKIVPGLLIGALSFGHLPGASFVNPGTKLRDALTREATERALAITALGNAYTPAGRMIDERSIVNGVIGLHATGGSTNHTIHLIAMAAAAGIRLTWQDISDLSDAVPLLARVYPNGLADVNHFHAAGGMGFLIRELLDAGLLHEDVQTIWGEGLRAYAIEARLGADGTVEREAAPTRSGDEKVLAPATKPFQPTGGLRVLSGNLGHAVIKTSAIKPDRHIIEAPARVFDSQEGLNDAFKAGSLTGDFIAVIRFQGPKANGMPELHRLITILGILQDRGHRVALVTDGRMSGASGKVPAAIHVTPEAFDGGPIGKVRDGDLMRLDAEAGTLELLIPAAELVLRPTAHPDLSANDFGMGRELFAGFRQMVGHADSGATVFAAA
jgi:dihydroxyacid dehydratase/phosphogluconate dehydratase